MNGFSKELGLSQVWGNSSGLSANPNTVTAESIMYLTALALTHPVFVKVVNTKEY